MRRLVCWHLNFLPPPMTWVRAWRTEVPLEEAKRMGRTNMGRGRGRGEATKQRRKRLWLWRDEYLLLSGIRWRQSMRGAAQDSFLSDCSGDRCRRHCAGQRLPSLWPASYGAAHLAELHRCRANRLMVAAMEEAKMTIRRRLRGANLSARFRHRWSMLHGRQPHPPGHQGLAVCSA